MSALPLVPQRGARRCERRDSMTGDRKRGQVIPLRDAKHCGARRRQGDHQPCRRPAGWGTDHPGEGRCKLHGGASPGADVRVARSRARKMLLDLGRPDPVGDPLDELRRLAAGLRILVDDLAGRIGDDLVHEDSGKLAPLYLIWRDLVDRLQGCLSVLARAGTPDVTVTVHQGVPVTVVLERVAEAVRPFPEAAAAVSLAMRDALEGMPA